jgi:uncharacterized protein (DUF433 family)
VNTLRYLSRNDDVVGGQTVFTGTRVALKTILASLAEGDTVAELLVAFPSLTEEHLWAAVAFAAESALEDQPLAGVPQIV